MFCAITFLFLMGQGSGVGAGVLGMQAPPQNIFICQIFWEKSQKIWLKKLCHLFATLMKSYFVVIECMHENLLRRRKHITLYKINTISL